MPNLYPGKFCQFKKNLRNCQSIYQYAMLGQVGLSQVRLGYILAQNCCENFKQTILILVFFNLKGIHLPETLALFFAT